jgi:hypothetical protein
MTSSAHAWRESAAAMAAHFVMAAQAASALVNF